MLSIIKENIKHIPQILKLAKSEVVRTYKGSALGSLWAIIKPSFLIFIYWFAIELGLRGNRSISGGYPFIIFLVAGIVPWFFISDAISDGAKSIRSHKYLVTKMPFPVSTIMTFVTLSKLYVNIGITAIVYIILLFCGYMPSLHNIQILFYMPLMFIFFTALSWITAPLSCISKDFENLVKTIITAIFWLSGIIWDPYSLQEGLLKKMILLNPVTYFVNGYRNTFIYHKWFFETPYETIGFCIILILVIVSGSLVYNRLRKRILDVL